MRKSQSANQRSAGVVACPLAGDASGARLGAVKMLLLEGVGRRGGLRRR